MLDYDKSTSARRETRLQVVQARVILVTCRFTDVGQIMSTKTTNRQS